MSIYNRRTTVDDKNLSPDEKQSLRLVKLQEQVDSILDFKDGLCPLSSSLKFLLKELEEPLYKQLRLMDKTRAQRAEENHAGLVRSPEMHFIAKKDSKADPKRDTTKTTSKGREL